MDKPVIRYIMGRYREFYYSHNEGNAKVYTGRDDNGNVIVLRFRPRWAPADGYSGLCS